MSTRLPAAAAIAGLTASISYVVQRIGALFADAPSATGVLAQEHIPFYWRCAMAAWHGLALGFVAWLLLRDEARAERWTELLTRALPPAVAALIVLTVVFP